MSFLSSLFRKKTSVPLWTGRTVLAREFQQTLGAWEIAADSTYAEVNSAALPAYYDWFRTKLYDFGVVRWDQRQDCDDFANLYADFLQLRLYLGQWERDPLPNAEGVAVARYWYRPNLGNQLHAINAVLTEKGLTFIEPQTGQLLTPTTQEQATRLRCIF